MQQSKRFPIVGIGASAGGVEALQTLFTAMPRDMQMAFVVVTHLGPDRESALPQILAGCTAMPIAPAQDGDTIQPGHAYVLSTDAALTIADGRISLHPANARVERKRHPIDSFLMSLGADRNDGAVGILLSGGGNDGTLGLKLIRARGGLTLAQGSNGTSPGQHSMPDSAVASGAVDLFIPVEDMPARLIEFAASLQESGTADDAADGDEDAEAATARVTIGTILRTQVGHDFSGYKARTFMRGVQRRMKLVQMTGLAGYVERLEADPKEAICLFQELLIGVTAFFRDAEAFAALSSEVIPRLLAGRGADDTVRIWLPACATGEEAYSLAILLQEQLETMPIRPKVQIFATDIDEPALVVARTGHYPGAALAHLSPERIARFFDTDGPVYSVSQDLRSLCIFSAQSVIRDAPFSRMDLISCRNLLIYLGAELQSQIIPIFHFALRPGGYLFLGISENISRHGDLFDTVNKRYRIFRRNERTLSPQGLARLAPLGSSARHSWLSLRTPLPVQNHAGPALRDTFETLMLEQYSPPSVVVTREGEVVYQGARLGRYLETGVGVPSRNLLAMAHRGLRAELRGALRDATEADRRIIRPWIEIEIDGVPQIVTLTVAPVPDRDKASPLFLVVFAEAVNIVPQAPAADPGNANHYDYASKQTAHFERELRDSRERLQSQVEEYETAAEELRSANEELVSFNEEQQSINEELETSREELQSINEELRTLNVELGSKIEELDRANTDLRNLFDSTQIATIFLDRHLTIRNFTPAVTRIFNLVPTDRGRPLSAFASRIEALDLRADVRQVLDQREPVERRVGTASGDVHYMMRLLPYITTEGAVDGAVLTFVDITSVVEREELRTLVGELNHRVRNMLQVVMAVSRHTLRQSPSLEIFGKAFLGRLQALGRAHELVSRSGWSRVPLIDLLQKETEPYLGTGNRLGTEGPPVMLTPKAALALGLALHEMTTNSVKYGALSVEGGHVAVSWSVAGEGQEAMLTLGWIEAGGPKVVAPTRRGLGSTLIERQVRGDLCGTAEFEFAEAGLRITLGFAIEAGAEVPSLQPEAAIEWNGSDAA